MVLVLSIPEPFTLFMISLESYDLKYLQFLFIYRTVII